MIPIWIFSILVIVFLAVGPGYQASPFGLPIALALLLHITRSNDRSTTQSSLIVFGTTTIGMIFAYAGTFELDKKPSVYSLYTWLMVPCGMFYALWNVVIFLVDRWVWKYFRPPPLVDAFITFPAICTAVWSLFYRFTIFGDMGTFHSGVMLLAFDALTRGISFLFGSFSGGCYVTALLAVWINKLFLLMCTDSSSACSADNIVICEKKTVKHQRESSLSDTIQVVKAIALLLCALIAVGSISSFSPSSFFQTPLVDIAPKYIPVSCITFGSYADVKLAVETTPSKIVITSELSVNVTNEEDFLDPFLELATAHNTIIGVGYGLNETSSSATETGLGSESKNMFALIVPPFGNSTKAKIGFKYQKSHPVPGVELGVIPGDGKLLFAETPYGTISAAICFDFNFPLLNQLSRRNVSIMLQPSYTWGPMGPSHARVNRMRAMDHGFTMFRCSAYGVSGVYGPNGEIFGQRETVGKGFNDSMISQMPIKSKQWSVYDSTGDILGSLSMAAFMYWSYLLIAQRGNYMDLSN